MSLLAGLPVVGRSCAIAKLCLVAGKALGTGFTNLVLLDKKYIEPLRQAIQKTASLRRSRKPENLAPTVSALDAAIVPLQAYELASIQQQQKLTALTTALKGLDFLMPSHKETNATNLTNVTKTQEPSSLSNTVHSLEKLSAVLSLQTTTVHQLRQYAGACADDGHQALTERQVIAEK